MRTLRATGLLFLIGLAACAAPPSADDLDTGTQDLRPLTSDELLGEIHYGDDVKVAYTGKPMYRAYWFNGTKGDWLDVKIASSTNDHYAFVVDDQFRNVRRGTRAVLPHTGKYYLAVRSGDLETSTISIQFALTVVHAGDAPPAASVDEE